MGTSFVTYINLIIQAMGTYTLEDYSRDLKAKTESELYGSIFVSRDFLHRFEQILKIDADRAKLEMIRESCLEHIPILLQELKRRNLEAPRWVEPSYWDNLWGK